MKRVTTNLVIAILISVLIVLSVGKDIYTCNYSGNGVEMYQIKEVYYIIPYPKIHSPLTCTMLPDMSVWITMPNYNWLAEGK